MLYDRIIYYEDSDGEIWPGRIVADGLYSRTIQWADNDETDIVTLNDWRFWDNVVISCA